MKRAKGAEGFTIVELMVYLFISVILIGAVYQVLIGQNRLFSKQREIQDVRGTLRSAGYLLAYELRQANAGDGDIYAIADTAFMLRSVRASGTICAIHPTGLTFGLYNTSGNFDEPTYNLAGIPTDTAFIYASNSSGTSDDQWYRLAVKQQTDNPALVDMSYCVWADTATYPVEWAVQIDTSWIGMPTGIKLGAPMRIWERIGYSIYFDPEDGRWWLGRLDQVITDQYIKLAGPLKSPADSGLTLTYYDSTGTVTADPTLVHRVDILLRGESYGKARSGSGLPIVSEDSLTVSVYLRG